MGYSVRMRILAFLLLSLSGCFYTNIKAPLDTELNSTVLGSKAGKASSHSVLFLVAWGDSGTAAAADAGGITTITHLDAEIFSILFGAYTRVTTVAYGN